MGQDLGQTKALTEKEKGEIFTGQLSLFQICIMLHQPQLYDK